MAIGKINRIIQFGCSGIVGEEFRVGVSVGFGICVGVGVCVGVIGNSVGKSEIVGFGLKEVVGIGVTVGNTVGELVVCMGVGEG